MNSLPGPKNFAGGDDDDGEKNGRKKSEDDDDPSDDHRDNSKVNFLLIYICNFHVLYHFLLIYICKLHWNRRSLR